MHKKIIIYLSLLLFIAIIPLYAKDKIKKLTPLEIADVNDFLANDLTPDPNWVKDVYKSKAFKGTTARNKEKAQGIEKFRDKVKAGGVKCKKRGADGYETVTATMADIRAFTDILDRPWNSDPNYLEDILNKLRCPLDGHLYRAIGDPNAI